MLVTRIIDSLELIQDEIDRRQQKPGAGWDKAAALKHWAEICGPTRMDWELWVFVDREVRRRGKETARAWQKMLCELISSMLRNGMPMELLSPRPTFYEEARQALNAEEALLAVLNACARVTGEVSRIDWLQAEMDGGGRTAFGGWLKRLQGQRIGDSALLVFHCLSMLDLSGQLLYVSDLYGANLEGTYLVRTGLTLATLAQTNLQQADLQLADLQRSILQGANLQGADLRWAKLPWANLGGANLKEANLRGADLKGAYLEGANLEGARLDDKAQLKEIRGTFLGEPRFHGRSAARKRAIS